MAIDHAPTVAVIGAGYGDEGKGLLTDALCRMLGPAVAAIRHNGGAQAGHTVRLADGRAHVFHHVGSGSFAGAGTVLPRFFVANPLVLRDEIAALANLGVHPRIVADERALLTTPWDMLINQLIEEARGGARHGSCGLGFGETIERCRRPAYATTLADLRGDLADLARRFDAIRREWVPARLTALGQPGLWLAHRDRILSAKGFAQALALAAGMLAQLDLAFEPSIAADRPVVFEGAQGLMLDQARGAFPHVTRSSTGLDNVLPLMAGLGRSELTAVYATRAYVTRHGAGPLAHEQDGPPTPLFDDPTNRPNPWQGRLRFGLLDVDILDAAIRADLANAAALAPGIRIHARLAVTCLDQVAGRRCAWVEGGKVRQGRPRDLVRRLSERLPCTGSAIESHGPTGATVSGLAPAMAIPSAEGG